MTGPERDPIHLLKQWLLATPKRGAIAGYLVFAAGMVLGIYLALQGQGKDNPFLVLIVVWLIAGITQILDRSFWRPCVISGIGSALAYTIAVVVLLPDEAANNEMFGVGIFEAGLFGFVLSMVMGIPVRAYRRARSARIAESSIERP
jgi:hypothetical protein